MPPKDNFFVKILLVFGTIASAFAVIALAAYYGKNATSAPVSYQAQNLEALQSIQTGDLVICTLRDASGHTTVRRVIFVEQRDEKHLLGYEVNHFAVERIVGGLPLSTLENCEIRILRNRTLAREYIGDTILRGRNPGHLHG